MKAQASALALGKDQGKKAATCCAEIKEAYFPDEVWNFDSLHCITSVWVLLKDPEIFIFPSLYFLILHVNTLMAIRQKKSHLLYAFFLIFSYARLLLGCLLFKECFVNVHRPKIRGMPSVGSVAKWASDLVYSLHFNHNAPELGVSPDRPHAFPSPPRMCYSQSHAL